MRELVTAEEIAEALWLIAGLGKDGGADGAGFGVADEQAGQE